MLSQSAIDTEVLTLEEACELLRISRPTIFELIKRGEIPCRKVGRIWRFHRPAVLDWLEGKPRVSRSRS